MLKHQQRLKLDLKKWRTLLDRNATPLKSTASLVVLLMLNYLITNPQKSC